LDGKQKTEVALAHLLGPFPSVWEHPKKHFSL
jgi:hypothetical protein